VVAHVERELAIEPVEPERWHRVVFTGKLIHRVEVPWTSAPRVTPIQHPPHL